MKKYIGILLFFLAGAKGVAQDRQIGSGAISSSNSNPKSEFELFDKNKTLVGGGFGAGGATGFWSIWFQGRYGRFLTDRWNTGVDATIQFGSGYSAFTVGPYTRFYLFKYHISPVIEINYNYFTENNTQGFGNYKTYGTFAQGLFGVSWLGVFDNFGAEFLLNTNLIYNLKERNNITGETIPLRDPGNIGFTYRLVYFF